MAALLVGGIALGVDKIKARKQRKREERAQSLDAGIGSSSRVHPRDSAIPEPLSEAEVRKAREASEERRRREEEEENEEDAAPAYVYEDRPTAIENLPVTQENAGDGHGDGETVEAPPSYLKHASHEETVLDTGPARQRRRTVDDNRPFRREYREAGAIVPHGTETAERLRRDTEAPAVRGREPNGRWREPDGVWREGDLERPPSPGAKEGETPEQRKKRKVAEYWKSYKFWSLMGVGFAR